MDLHDLTHKAAVWTVFTAGMALLAVLLVPALILGGAAELVWHGFDRLLADLDKKDGV